MTESTGNVPGRIFMSYRRDDTDFPAAWLYIRLASHFGRSQVFKDVDSIEVGDDFVEVITTAVESSHVLLALIGKQWLTITGQDGRRRLDDSGDFVRLEIEAALARDIRVIPILVGGAQVPRPEELPESLVKLARRQAFELSPRRFDDDAERLLRRLDRAIAKVQEQARQEAERATVGAQNPGAAQTSQAELVLSATVIDLGRLPQYGQSPEHRVRVGNAGGGDLNAWADTSASWIRLRTGGDELAVTVDTSAPGEYEGTVTVDSEGGTATIRVHAWIDPAPLAGRLVGLQARLARSQSSVGSALQSLLSRDQLEDQTWEEIEDVLIAADVGVAPARQMVDDLRTKVKVLDVRGPAEVHELLRAGLLKQLGEDTNRTLHVTPHDNTPAVVLMVGMNGSGKTTTTAKIAQALIGHGRTVLTAETSRVAAANPASVVFEAVSQGIETGADVVVIDTDSRRHTKADLMNELGKVKRMVERKATVDEVLLVLDATTGQNGLRQARLFAEVVDVTGIVLTKLDQTAKGGIVIAVQRVFGVPVKLVGLGDGPDDLALLEPAPFVDAILG
jgi:fused signal recognition particle receptor